MDVFKGTEKSPDNKLLKFRAPSPALRGLEGSPDLDLVPHDIAMLRRPNPLQAAAAIHFLEQDAPEAGAQHSDSLAHDARTLITSLERVSNLLAEPGVLSADHLHYVGDLNSLTYGLGALVERVERMAPKSEAGAPVFTREPLRQRPTRLNVYEAPDAAGAIVKNCETLLAAIASPAVALQIDCERGLGELALSGEEMTRVLIHLVRNASEAMPSGGRVEISVRKGPGLKPAAIITVQDTGAGIPAHALGQIFQAGFSSKEAKHRWPKPAHYGLGLTIVRELVEGAGGSVRVTSALRRGTTFQITLPCRYSA